MTPRISACAVSLIAALLLYPGRAPAQAFDLFPADQLARIQQGLQDIYGMDYGRAEQNFQLMIREAPSDPAGYAYLAMTYWVQELSRTQELSIDRFAASSFFVSDPRNAAKIDTAAGRRFRELSQQAVDLATERLARDPGDRTARFVRGLAYQNLASFEVSRQGWWGAARQGKRSLGDSKELLKKNPNLADAKLAVGVCDYAAGSVPWTFRWVAVLMGLPGNRDRGRKEMEEAASKAVLVADDARVVLILIYALEKNYRRAGELLLSLHTKYPQNYLAHLDMGGMALLNKEPDKAIAIYQEILRKRDAREPKYADIERALLYSKLGVAYRKKGDLEGAGAWFRRALQEEQASSRALVIARLELAKTLDLQGQRGQALEFYRQVAAAEDIAGSRSEAERLLRKPYRE